MTAEVNNNNGTDSKEIVADFMLNPSPQSE